MNELMRRLLILSVVLVFHTACAQYVCAQLPPLAVVHVIVTYEDGTPVPDALVEIKNLNTNAVINDSTDENGSCACAIPSSADWKIGDEILISAQDAFGNYAETNLTITDYPLIEVNLTLVATPPPSPTQSPSLSPTPTTSPTESPTTTTTTTPTVPLPTPTEIPTTTETPMSPTTAGTPSAATTPPESPFETPTSPTPTPGFSLIIMSIATITAIYLRRRLNERK